MYTDQHAPKRVYNNMLFAVESRRKKYTNAIFLHLQEFSFGDRGGHVLLIKLRGETCPSCFSLKWKKR